MAMDIRNLKPGVSGIMRVKDDAEFIEICVESCIDALDELIIVYNDCSDNSPEIINMMYKRFPDKIKVFPYNYHIYALNLSKEEYEYALSLPTDSPHLLCNYYNFALSKVTCQYALKIDADQIYFSEKLKKICDMARNKERKSFNFQTLIGLLVFLWSVIVKKINILSGCLCYLFPARMSDVTRRCYNSFVEYCITRDFCISLSGINLFCLNNTWMVPLGLKKDNENILPPFNGAGDHLLFRMVENCYYEKYDYKEYSSLRNDSYTLIERFVHPHKILSAGYFWTHLNMMRQSLRDNNLRLITKFPDRFMRIEKFLSKLNYYKIDKLIDHDIYGIELRSYSQFCFSMDGLSLISNLSNAKSQINYV